VLLVEDDASIREVATLGLEQAGLNVTAVGDAASMRALAEHETFQLAILDIAMPGEDGLSLARWLRSQMPIGIIFATASGTSIDRIVGLEIGADDYVVKPYELRELLARVRSVLRRVPAASESQPRAASTGEPDAPRPGLTKINPIADWSVDQVWAYIKENDVPYNKLHDRNFPSIGCSPCTRPVAAGEDIRAGRWWWELPEQKECGLHVNHPARAGESRPGANDDKAAAS